MSRGKVIETKELDFTTFANASKLLTPDYVLFDLPTNDRMKYQQGAFCGVLQLLDG